MFHVAPGCAAPQACSTDSVSVPDRADERTARLLACSVSHAKHLRLEIIPQAIAAILMACRDDATKREAFRRHCLVALSQEPDITVTADLLVAAQAADAEEDKAETRYLLERTPAALDDLIRRSRSEIGMQQDRLRGLERERERMTR